MTDFPRSLIEFQQRFGDEAACAIPCSGALAQRVCLPGMVAKPGGRKRRPGPMSAPAAVAKPLGRSLLAGLVEVGETEIACRSQNDPVTGGGGRRYQGKMPVAGAVEVEDGELGPV